MAVAMIRLINWVSFTLCRLAIQYNLRRCRSAMRGWERPRWRIGLFPSCELGAKGVILLLDAVECTCPSYVVCSGVVWVSRCRALPSPKKRPRRTVARIAPFGVSRLV
jgi:hypothetical protein